MNSRTLNTTKEIRLDIAELVEREKAMYRETSITHGEFLLPNLWVNRNTGTRAYYEFSWHDGDHYRMLDTCFEDIGVKMDETKFYEVYQLALHTAFFNPDLPYNLTMCQLEDKYER